MKIILKMNQNQPKGKSYNVTHFSLNSNDKDQATSSLSKTSTSKSNCAKTVIERGASWSYNETTILLSLWGQDMVQRQLTNSKRTRHVWEKIANKIQEFGYKRTPDQVRTRVFNMIAEYRRILKAPSDERIKKCSFFHALHRVYQAKDVNGVRAALSSNDDEHQFLDQIDFDNDQDENYINNNDLVIDNSTDPSEVDDKEVFTYAVSPSNFNQNLDNVAIGSFGTLNNLFNNKQFSNYDLNNQSLNTSCNSNFNSFLNNNNNNSNHKNQNYPTGATKNKQSVKRTAIRDDSRTNSLNGLDSDNNHSQDSWLKRKGFDFDLNSKPRKRTAIVSNRDEINDTDDELNLETTHELVDKMFDYLAKCNQSMLEWVKLEQIRLQQDLERRKEENEKQDRREKQFLEALISVQNTFLKYINNNNSDNIDNSDNQVSATPMVEDNVIQQTNDKPNDSQIQQSQPQLQQQQPKPENLEYEDVDNECFKNYNFTSVLHEEIVESIN